MNINESFFNEETQTILDIPKIYRTIPKPLRKQLIASRKKLKNIAQIETAYIDGEVQIVPCNIFQLYKYKPIYNNISKEEFIEIIQRIIDAYTFTLNTKLYALVKSDKSLQEFSYFYNKYSLDIKDNSYILSIYNCYFNPSAGSICVICANDFDNENKHDIFKQLVKGFFMIIMKHYPQVYFFESNMYTEEFYTHRIIFLNEILTIIHLADNS